jgi:hypothetical protein
VWRRDKSLIGDGQGWGGGGGASGEDQESDEEASPVLGQLRPGDEAHAAGQVSPGVGTKADLRGVLAPV